MLAWPAVVLGGSMSRHPTSFAASNALLTDGPESSHEFSSLENTSAWHCIWGFELDFALGLPFQHPPASAPHWGLGVRKP